MKYDAILIDADDTLFDFRAAERAAIGDILTLLGIQDVEAPQILKINRASSGRLERGELTQKELRVLGFATFSSIPAAIGTRRDWRKVYAIAFPAELSPSGRFGNRAGNRQKRPVVVVTNGISSVQRSRMDASPLKQYIHSMVVSGEIGVQKPDPRMLYEALSRLGNLPAERALMVGDSLTSDVLAANRAGVDACWYNPEQKPLREGFHVRYEIRDIRALTEIALG